MNLFSRPLFRLGAVGAVLFSSAIVAVAADVAGVSAARTARASKYAVCHRTNAIKNPYRRINVAWSSVDRDARGHDNPVHDGRVFDYEDPQRSHRNVPRDFGTDADTTNDRWGDIFYAVKTGPGQGQGNNDWNANNWFIDDTNDASGPNLAGQAIFEGATNALTGKPACRAMSASDFIRSEIEAQRDNPNLGITMEDVMKDLDEQNAAEDLPSKKALGGSFENWYKQNGNNSQDPSIITQAIEAVSPSVTTEPPTEIVVGSDVSAKLNGTVSPKGQPMTYYYEFNTDQTFPDASTTEIPLGSGNSSTRVDVNSTQSSLLLNTTYYYRTVGVVTDGSGDDQVETLLYGVIELFNSASPVAPTISGVVCGNQKLTVTFATSSTADVDKYQYSLDGGAWTDATLSGAVGNATNSFEISNLTNGNQYSVRVRAFENTGTVPGYSSASVAGTPCGLPAATTQEATSVKSTSAVINGIVTSNGATTTVKFEYKARTGSSCATEDFSNATSVEITNSLDAGAVDSSQSYTLTGLTPGTTYCFRILGSNVPGSAIGDIKEFVTPLNTTSDDPLGRVIGTAWFDMNKNNQRESNEPLLPGVPVNLTPTSTASVQSARTRVRTQAQTLNTNADGSFDFTTVAPGTYRISGALPGSFGIEQSWDSTGNSDWSVTVTVVALQTSRGDFAAIADVLLNAGLDPADCETLNNTGNVSMTWAGFDQTSGNSDDTSFTTKLKDDCTFKLDGVPTGKYTLTVINPTTKKSVSVRTLSIPKNSTGVSVKISGKSATVTVVKANAILPATGIKPAQMSLISTLIALAGLFMVQTSVLTRRRLRRR